MSNDTMKTELAAALACPIVKKKPKQGKKGKGRKK